MTALICVLIDLSEKVKSFLNENWARGQCLLQIITCQPTFYVMIHLPFLKAETSEVTV